MPNNLCRRLERRMMADLRRNEVLTEEDDPNRFATRIDNWLLAILAGAGIISVASVLLSASQDSEAAVVSAVLLIYDGMRC